MIYYVEDDKNIRDLVLYTLGQTGFEAAGFAEGRTFWQACRKTLPELVILDIMLPGEDGLAILKKLRRDSATQAIPVILLTAKGAEYDKVVGLDSGADDYITKPFGMMEFVARVKAALRRAAPKEEPEELSHRGVSMNTRRRIVTTGGAEIALTFKEFELLKFLLLNKGIVLDRDSLLDAVWGYHYDGGTRTVDVHIQTLRQKLRASGSLIETVRGVGYRIGDGT